MQGSPETRTYSKKEKQEEIKSYFRELMGQGLSGFELCKNVGDKFGISPKTTARYLTKTRAELKAEYAKSLEDDIQWMKQKRNTADDGIAVAYQREINKVLGRHIERHDITTDGKPLDVIININHA